MILGLVYPTYLSKVRGVKLYSLIESCHLWVVLYNVDQRFCCLKLPLKQRDFLDIRFFLLSIEHSINSV